MPRHLSTFLILSVTLPLRAAELPPVARWQLDRGHLTTRSIRPLAGRLKAAFTGPIKFSTNRKSGPTGTLELSGQSSPRQRFQVATDIRLYLRDAVDDLIELEGQVLQAILGLAEQHTDAIMPGFTHLQAAQPITFGHHMMAWFEMLWRDRDRLMDSRKRINQLPLGAAALAGTP